MDAFYFGGTLIGKRSLRTALLYYDHVLHYDVKRFFGQFYDEDPQLTRVLDDFYGDTELLRQEGALRLLDLDEWVWRYGRAFEVLPIVYQDPVVTDPMLYRLVHSSAAPRLLVLYSFGKGTRWALPETRRDWHGSQKAYYSETNAWSLEPESPSHVDMDRFTIMSVAREVAYGLLGGIEFDAAPLTDYHSYDLFLQHLLYTLFCWGWGFGIKPYPQESRLNERDLRDALQAVGASERATSLIDSYLRRNTYRRSALIDEVIAMELPSFDNVPDEDLLDIRERCRDSLVAFREEMHAVERLVGAEARFAPEERNEMVAQIRELVVERVSPKVSELTKAMSSEATKIRRSRVTNLVTTAATLTANAFVPFALLLLPILAVGGKIASDELNHLLDRLEARKDSMYFLLQLKHAQSKTPGT